jgi:hypothetical protein
MNSTLMGLRPTVGLRRPKRISFASAEADAWRAAPGKADFNRRESLRPTVGLRRPGGCLLRRRRPTLGVERPERPISIGGRAFGQRSACADRKGILCVGEGRRLARSASEGRFPIGVKAYADRGGVFCVGGGRRLAWSAWRGRFQSAGGPSADGRPVRRMNSAFEGLWPTVGLRRPGRYLLRRWRPTPGAARLGRPISIGVKAFGRRSACADRKGILCVGEGRRLARSASEGRFPIGVKAYADREGVFCVGGGRRLARSA